jgi:hypothetical protein
VLLCVVLFALGHAAVISSYLDRVSSERFEATPAEGFPSDITLGIAADGRTWLRLTDERIARGDLRFNLTQIDGPSEGREVRWHSAWSWWLEGLGRIRAAATGETLSQAIALASRWAHVPLLLALALGGGRLVARRWGATAGMIFAAALVGHRGFYIAFFPAYPDHHGLAAAAALGVIAGLAWAGWGMRAASPGASLAAVISALCGAVGLAVSAASLAPLLAVVGASSLLARFVVPRFADRDVALAAGAKLWQLWGRAGAAAALVLYLLEFAPHRFAWRLEVNHPAHALAWWGGAELIAWWWRRGAGAVGAARFPWWAAPLVLSPLAVVFLSGGAAFGASDVFLQAVHRHIDEFKPVWAVPSSVGRLFALTLLPLVLAPFAWRRCEGGSRAALLGVACAAIALSLLAAWQHRWWSIAGAAHISLAVLVAAAFCPAARAGAGGRVVACLLLAASVPGPFLLAREQWRVARLDDVQKGEAMQLLFRELARVVREATPEGARPVLVGPPNASLGVGYHADLRAVGTLYWENHDGLRAAARVLAATEDDAAFGELLDLGATHLLLIDPGDFTAEYHESLAAAGAPAAPLAATLGRRLLEGRDVPAWAKAIPFAVPPQFGRLKVRVALYAFEPALSPRESRLALGFARLVAGEESLGRSLLREAAREGSPDAALFLAWRIVSGGSISREELREAVFWAERGVEAMPASPSHRRVLAAAYAAAGRWPEAQAAILRAIDLAEEAGDRALAAELEREFGRYRSAAARGGAEAR